eukprot:m.5016 g.5016  ORF g.5016 m.5016 type:complete len:97 (-) comp3325_c0_seq1:19-309(-)
MLRVVTGLLRGARRGVMSPKQGNKHYYKGKGGRSVGFHTRRGGFIVDSFKRPNFVVPDLQGFELKPYVSRRAPASDAAPLSGHDVLAALQKERGAQ